ncbi:hypothetical protein GCM10022384_02040 [Streptomyces marokkonensis]|uniref:Uncharacterized protein n=2 Tax=Streptomyces marokkonensis TaxID=324855 RepID=A0ABP7NQE5_9ACTN
MTIRYAALDLDGTLIDSSDRPYPGVVEGPQALRALGVLPLLVSGRAARSFRDLRHLDDLFAQVDDEVLLSEGNVLLSLGSGHLSFPLTCKAEVLQRLTDEPGIDLVAEHSGEFHATPRVPRSSSPWPTGCSVGASRSPVRRPMPPSR